MQVKFGEDPADGAQGKGGMLIKLGIMMAKFSNYGGRVQDLRITIDCTLNIDSSISVQAKRFEQQSTSPFQ